MKFYWSNLMGDEGWIETDNIVEAVYDAWNYEAELFREEDDELVFSPYESNEFNSELLEPFGFRVIDTEKYRQLQNIETSEIHKAPWERD